MITDQPCQFFVVPGGYSEPEPADSWVGQVQAASFVAQAAHQLLQFSDRDAVRIHLGGRGGAWRVPDRYGSASSSSKRQRGAPPAGEA